MGITELAPLLLFVYRRSEKTEKLLKRIDELDLVELTDLYVFCDGSKGSNDKEDVLAVQKKVHEYKMTSKCKSVHIIQKEANQGLANSIITGVTSVIDRYGKVIVLEDDLFVSKDFLVFMNEALDFYMNDNRIFSIGGRSKQIREFEREKRGVYFHKVFECWGWAIWKNRWERIKWSKKFYIRLLFSHKMRKRVREEIGSDYIVMLKDYINKRIDSWAVRVVWYEFYVGMYTVIPCKMKVINHGLDGSGTNCGIVKNREVEQIYEERLPLGEFYVNNSIEKTLALYNSRWKEQGFLCMMLKRLHKAIRK